MERTERDSLGEMGVPADRYYGIQTVRAVRNFAISGRSIAELPHLLRALALVKSPPPKPTPTQVICLEKRQMQ